MAVAPTLRVAPPCGLPQRLPVLRAMAPLQQCASTSSSIAVKQLHGTALHVPIPAIPRSRRNKSGGSCRCLNWDPEGVLGPPQEGLIATKQFARQYKDEEERKKAMERAAQLEMEQRKAAREARVVPSTFSGLVEYFLETEGREMEFEIVRCRPKLTEDFFRYLKAEIGQIRFGLNKTQADEDKIIELEALQKVLQEGVEKYDKLAGRIVDAKDRLIKILTSKDIKATLLELAGENKLDRGLLALLDENIAAAAAGGKGEMAQYMEKVRQEVVKYIIV